MPDPTITTFLTVESISSYGGASIAVVAVSNTIRRVFNKDKAWIPFVISLAVAYAGIYLANDTITMKNGIISFFNGCLLFTSSAGLEQGLVRVVKGAPAGEAELRGGGRVPWLSRWL